MWWQRLTAQPHAEQPLHIVFRPSCDKTTIASCGQLLGLLRHNIEDQAVKQLELHPATPAVSKQLRVNSPEKHSKKENQKQKEQKRNQNHSKSKSYWVAVFFPSLLSLAEKLVLLVWIGNYLIVKDRTVHLFKESSNKSALSSQSLSLARIDSLHSCQASHFPASRYLCPHARAKAAAATVVRRT